MIVVSAVLSSVAFAIIGGMQISIRLASLSIQRVQSATLLEEGAEVVRFLRDTAWSNISGLTIGTTYYPTWTGTTWTLSTTPVQVDNLFTRTVVFSNAYRDGSNKLATSGTLDTNTRKVTVTTTWQGPSGQVTDSLDLYISKIF